MPGNSGLDLLPFYAPDFYAKQLPIQRQQALAQMLMQQGSGDPGNARYGGLRNAGSMLAGALLGRYSDRKLGQLYTGPESPGATQGGQDTGQISNAAESNPDLQGNVQQPYEGTDTTNLFPGLHNTDAAIPKQTAAPTTPANDSRFPPIQGLSQRDSMLLFLSDPAKYLETVAQQNGPTDFMKSAAALYGRDTPQYRAALQSYEQKQTTPDAVLQAQFAAAGNPQAAQQYAATQFQTPEQRNAQAAYPGDQAGQTQAIRAQVEKAGTQDIRQGNLIKLANGGWMQTPDREGRYTIYDANMNPVLQAQVPGSIQNAAAQAGAVTGAQQANTIFTGSVGGREGVPYRGADVPRLGAPSGPTNNLSFGITPAERTAGGETGKLAATAGEVKSTTESLLKSIDDAIEESKGFGGYTVGFSPEFKAEFGQRSGIDDKSMTHLNNYKQLVGVAILNGLQNLRGLGRADLPEVNEVVKTYGVDANNNPEVREAGLRNLKTIVQRRAAAAQNAVANMNQPGAVTNTAQAPIPGQASPTASATTALPPQAKAQLREGDITTFKNGQKWTLQNGQPARVQ